MKLILTHDVERLGKAGEIIEVKDGFGRNYLIPRGFATKWTKGAQKQVDLLAEARRKRAIASLEDANAVREAVEGVVITIAKAAGENGRLFGGVSAADIASAVKEQTGAGIDRRNIVLPSAIKALGKHSAKAHLHDDITVSLSLDIVEEKKSKKRK
ncbi:MAG: 50S ribosomal protein L9 [Actinomycetaceae bacterium]|nr:50S ribosomal protein L9 [Actinomycetaceae bacterium]